jgi:hypothetical protein
MTVQALLNLFLLVFPVGMVIGIIQSICDNLPRGKPPEPEPDYETEEKREFLEGQLRDLKRLYTLDEMALENAQTIAQQRAIMSRMVSLDKKIFDVQQKIYKLGG